MRNTMKKRGWAFALGGVLAGLLCVRCAQTVHHVGAEAASVKSAQQRAEGPCVFPNLYKTRYY
jgi:hypothetical protein